MNNSKYTILMDTRLIEIGKRGVDKISLINLGISSVVITKDVFIVPSSPRAASYNERYPRSCAHRVDAKYKDHQLFCEKEDRLVAAFIDGDKKGVKNNMCHFMRMTECYITSKWVSCLKIKSKG